MGIGSRMISTRVAIDLGRMPEFTLKSLLQFTRDRGNRIVKRTARFSRMILSPWAILKRMRSTLITRPQTTGSHLKREFKRDRLKMGIEEIIMAGMWYNARREVRLLQIQLLKKWKRHQRMVKMVLRRSLEFQATGIQIMQLLQRFKRDLLFLKVLTILIWKNHRWKACRKYSILKTPQTYRRPQKSQSSR